MHPRISQSAFYQHCPELVAHLLAMGEIPEPATLPATLLHLVKLRASQLNHCGFCQHMHAEEARQAGESQARLDVLGAWRELKCFSAREKAALAWAESLTLIHQGPVEDNIYQAALSELGEKALLALTAVILQINSWNRISAGLRFQPDFPLQEV